MKREPWITPDLWYGAGIGAVASGVVGVRWAAICVGLIVALVGYIAGAGDDAHPAE